MANQIERTGLSNLAFSRSLNSGPLSDTELGPMDSSADFLVYSQIKSLLVKFSFFPGEKIRVPDLADRLRVSATPVREALHRLYAERLLSLAPKRGFIVRDLDIHELGDLERLLMLLLKHSIDNHSARAPGSQIAAMISSEITVEGVEASIVAIASFSHSEELQRIVLNILDRTHFIRQLHLEGAAPRSEVAESLDLLRSALEKSNTAGAKAALDRWLEYELTWLPHMLKEALNRLYQRAHPLKTTRSPAPGIR